MSRARIVLCGLAIACLVGCNTTAPVVEERRPSAEPSPLEHARVLAEEGRLREAMIECIDLSRQDPLMPGLPELKDDIVRRLGEQRERKTTLNVARTDSLMSEDLDREKTLPDTYRLRQPVVGTEAPLRQEPSDMQRALKKPITVNLLDANLAAFIDAIRESDDINIVADADLGVDKAMNIKADNVPLEEVLDYVARNLGVQFSIGKGIIWATAGETTEGTVPMETRVYRLRKGLVSSELGGGGGGGGGGGTADIDLVETITRFVAAPQGADLMFDTKAHVLIVKNTRPNLALVEDLIEALDVCPPQVLIEARFISTSIDDLRELGIDWILNSPIGVTKKYVLRDGARVRANSTAIAPDSKIEYTPFANKEQGFNMTYQGLLTDPMFEAVLHALDTSGKARTLSVPKVTTINNREAKIRIGEDFRYFEEYDVQSIPSRDAGIGGGGTTYSSTLVPVGQPTVEELGIELTVTPSVGADMRAITLKLAPKISTFVRWETYEVATSGRSGTSGTANDANSSSNNTGVIKLPIFHRSEIETEVVAQSGETVVMGGLIDSNEQKKQESVPFLSAVPLIGNLFKHDSIEETKQNLLIFVTATLLSDRGESLIPLSIGRDERGHMPVAE